MNPSRLVQSASKSGQTVDFGPTPRPNCGSECLDAAHPCADDGSEDIPSVLGGTVDHESGDTPAPDDARAEKANRRGGGLGCAVEVIETLVLTLVIFFVIQNFVAQPFQVKQPSMERTFVEGDYVLVDRLTALWSPYTRGQVVVFQPPANWTGRKEPFIKRVIGVGGDTVEVRDGQVFGNGGALDEPN